MNPFVEKFCDYFFGPGKITYRKSFFEKPPKKDKYEIDKENLEKYSKLYYGVLGHYINEYARRSTIHLDWNYLIWQPQRHIKELIDGVEFRRLPIPEYIPFVDSPPPTPPAPVTPKPVRRALRRFKQFPDTPATAPEDRCKVCLVNKKIVGFFPCGHVGMCNACCATTYKKKFMTSLRVKKPYLSECLPLPSEEQNTSYENEEQLLDGIIRELSQPRFHRTMQCIFCKEKIKEFNLIYSI